MAASVSCESREWHGYTGCVLYLGQRWEERELKEAELDILS